MGQQPQGAHRPNEQRRARLPRRARSPRRRWARRRRRRARRRWRARRRREGRGAGRWAAGRARGDGATTEQAIVRRAVTSNANICCAALAPLRRVQYRCRYSLLCTLKSPPPCYEVEPPLCINLYKGGVLSSIKLSALIGYRQGKRLCEGDIEGASHKAYRLIKGRLRRNPQVASCTALKCCYGSCNISMNHQTTAAARLLLVLAPLVARTQVPLTPSPS